MYWPCSLAWSKSQHKKSLHFQIGNVVNLNIKNLCISRLDWSFIQQARFDKGQWMCPWKFPSPGRFWSSELLKTGVFTWNFFIPLIARSMVSTRVPQKSWPFEIVPFLVANLTNKGSIDTVFSRIEAAASVYFFS